MNGQMLHMLYLAQIRDFYSHWSARVCMTSLLSISANQFKVRMPRNRRYCPHCRETVSSNTYLKHRRLYFNSSSNSWAIQNLLAAATSSDESDLENEQFSNGSRYDLDEFSNGSRYDSDEAAGT